MRLVCFVDRNIPSLAELLAPIAEIRLFDGRYISNAELIECDALFTRSVTQVNEKLLDGTSVKFVATATAGYDHIDRKYLKDKNIGFASAPGANSNSVAEYVMFALLYWAKYRRTELAGKRLGIVGYGAIGRKIARYARQFLQMEVWINDPPLQNAGFEFPQDFRYVELDELCSNSHIISNHIPLISDGLYPTVNLFDEAVIDLLPQGNLFIHASRGGIVDEDAFVSRISSKKIDAVFDVFLNEPKVRQDIVLPSLLATPHIAGYSYEAKILGARMCAEAFYRYLKIQFPQPEFNFPGTNNTIAPSDIFSLLKLRRRLDEDSVAFKETMKLSIGKRASAFDTLRRNYPVRHETLR
ncbi:4-phosphoerythronate dehydrogenase PdxB [Ignavibacteria bacterium]|nr:4-phosphoerythronate dehydrogenase [Bacteroidota bacterium]MCZ2131923.1 4-phosphoerythronate dehydrogenase [Bacteroidota bacterium]